MQQYILRRLLLMIPTLLGVTFLVFVMVRLMPGDVLALIAGDFGSTNEEVRAAILREFQLDQNVPQQYVSWLWNLLQLDLGSSLLSGREVSSELTHRLPITLELGVLSLAFNVMIGVPLGVMSALRQNTLADYSGRSLAIAMLAAPNFWLALLLIAMAGKYFTWGVPPASYVSLMDDPLANLKFMAVPALILGASSAGGTMRFMRTSMLEVLRQDYIRTARAKGLRERHVIVAHALRNALIPVVTVVGLSLPALVGGSVIIESVYSIPGMGRYYLSAINQLDFPVIQAINLVAALVVLFGNLLVDISYSWLNPRIRYS